MKLKQRLKISVAISTITILIVISILSVTMYNAKSALEEKKTADEIITNTLERSILASDYLATNNVMVKKQWILMGAYIGKILKSASEEFKNTQDKIIVKGLLENHESSSKLLLGIAEAREKAGSDPRHAVLYYRNADRLSSQLAIKRYATMEYARKLQKAGNQYLLSTLQIAGWSILFVIIVVTATMIINLWSMGRTITHRINHLRNSAIVIGQGDLNHRIQISGDDELTDFAHVFNTMTENVHKSYLDIKNEISYRKLAEEKLKITNEHLEAVNKELDAFSYSVAHDLRAPLVHMSGFAGLLQKRLSEHPDEKIHTYAATITGAAKRMEMLIDDLLAFSHIERSEMHKEKIRLNSLVKEVAEDIQSETRGQDILWEVHELPEVYGDQSLLRLVLINLLSNAVKYTRTRPRSEITIGYKDEEVEFIFFVKDNGVGFDMKCVDKLFGVFQRLHTQDEFEGTGIGLANVRRIISRHGGRTWAEGAVGQGATFYFTLPKAKEI